MMMLIRGLFMAELGYGDQFEFSFAQALEDARQRRGGLGVIVVEQQDAAVGRLLLGDASRDFIGALEKRVAAVVRPEGESISPAAELAQRAERDVAIRRTVEARQIGAGDFAQQGVAVDG